MATLGIMTLNLESEKTYFLEIARQAETRGLKCCKFTPLQINPLSEKVQGECYNGKTDRFEASEFNIPDCLYDRCFYGMDAPSKQCMAIVKWLKTRNDIIFLGYGLPQKLELYDKLKDTKLSPYLAPSHVLDNVESFLGKLSLYQPVMIKPINGSQGKGIYKIEKVQNGFQIQTDKGEKQLSYMLSDEKTYHWLRQLTAKYRYFQQPFLQLQNEAGEPFDIRALLQKDENGRWYEASRGIRTGRHGGIISNLNAGGYASVFTEWADTLPVKHRSFICSELDDVLNMLPGILEQSFPRLFEVGVDIGVDKNGAVWLLDINSKPGRKLALSLQPEKSAKLYTAPVYYAQYLLQSADKERNVVL